jgi:hypothetical protein
MNRFSVIALIFCLEIACRATVVDTETRFRFEGQITDDSGAAVSGVRVYFLDSGLDEWVSKSPKEHLLGQTDESGRIVVPFVYPSGYSRRGGRGGTPGTFRVLAKKDGFESASVDFRISNLTARDGEYVVPLKLTLRRSAA